MRARATVSLVAGGGGIGMHDQRFAKLDALTVSTELGECLALAQPAS